MRDKAIFSATLDRPEMVRFFVRLPKENGREAVVDSQHVMRYPRTFTKQVLRSFLKHTIARDRKDGSPWIVKEDIARVYNIPTQLPPELNPDVIQAERKARAEMKKVRNQDSHISAYEIFFESAFTYDFEYSLSHPISSRRQRSRRLSKANQPHHCRTKLWDVLVPSVANSTKYLSRHRNHRPHLSNIP